LSVSAGSVAVSVEELIALSTSPILLLGVVFVYSVLVAAILPFPAEAVLIVPLVLSSPWYVSFPVVILTSAAGKALGSLAALRIGYGVSRSGSVVRFTERIPYYTQFKDRKFTKLVRRYRYLGLTITLAIPFLPDTAPLYAFSVLENRPVLFAAAAFFGTILRLLIILLITGGVVTVVT
jgi:membrane protein YqaA with SNARE-associated domain